MRSKTILAAVIAGALGAPVAALAHGSSASSGASMNGDMQSSPSASVPPASSSDDQRAQNQAPSDEQSAQGSSNDEQSAQNDTDNSLIAGPSGNSENPYGSTGDPNLRQSSARA